MKQINIKCPYCGAKAILRPASVVHEHSMPGEKVYVCARYPACDAYVSAHRESHLPMGSLANRALHRKRRQAHLSLNRLCLYDPQVSKRKKIKRNRKEQAK